MAKVLNENSDKAHNFVISLIEKINHSLDYINEIKNMEIITEQNSLNFHLFFFNLIFTENFKLFQDFYDSIITKKMFTIIHIPLNKQKGIVRTDNAPDCRQSRLRNRRFTSCFSIFQGFLLCDCKISKKSME